MKQKTWDVADALQNGKVVEKGFTEYPKAVAAAIALNKKAGTPSDPSAQYYVRRHFEAIS